MKLIKLGLTALAAILISQLDAAAGENKRFEYRWNAHGERFGIFVPSEPATVAVYANRQGARGMQNEHGGVRFEFRTNANGQRFGIYVPVQ